MTAAESIGACVACDVGLCAPASPATTGAGAAGERGRRLRLGATVLSGMAGVAAVALLLAGERGPRAGTLLEYYQPWQARAGPAVDLQQLIGGYAHRQVQSAERGVMRALYRSANGGQDPSPMDPAVAPAPSYHSELDFLRRDLPSRQVAVSQLREQEQVRAREQLQEQVRELAHSQQARVRDLSPAMRAREAQQRLALKHTQEKKHETAGDHVGKNMGAVTTAEKLQQDSPPGYHLAWVSDKPERAKENGGRDELPYFPMPPLAAESRPDEHVEWTAPGPCMLRDGTDMQYSDAECQHHEVVDDKYPERPLLTTTFPSDVYRPDIQYPYIKGPFYHHLVDDNDNQYQGYQRGHWDWKPLGRARRTQAPDRGSYAEWFSDFRNPNNDGRYGQGYAQDDGDAQDAR